MAIHNTDGEKNQNTGNSAMADAMKQAMNTASAQSQAGASQANTEQNQQQFNQNQTHQQTYQPNFTFGNQGARMDQSFSWGHPSPNSPIINNTTTDGALKKISELFNNAVDDLMVPQIEVGVHMFDHRQHQLPISALVIVTRLKSDPSTAAAYILGLEASIGTLPTTDVQTPTGNVTYQYLASDTISGEVCDKLRALVHPHYNTPNLPSFSGASILSSRVDLNEDITRSALANAINASLSLINQVTSFVPDLNLAMGRLEGGSLQMTTEVRNDNNNVVIDSNGEQQRADIILKTTWIGQGARKGLNALGSMGTRELSVLTAYPEIALQPSNAQFRDPVTGQLISQGPMFRYMAVITSAQVYQFPGTAGTMLSLLHATALSDNDMWKRTLINREGPHDIGTLGIDITRAQEDRRMAMGGAPENNIQRFDTSPSNYSDAQHMQFINTWFHPSILYAIDVADASADTWSKSLIVMVADSNATGQDNGSKAELLRVLDTLFNGKFAQAYMNHGGNGTYFMDAGYRVITGSYAGKSDVQRSDARDFDYLAASNTFAGQQNSLATFDNYQATLYRFGENPNRAISERLSYLRSSLPDFHPTGYARRIIIEGAFLLAMREAAAACGYVVNNNDFYHNTETGSVIYQMAANMAMAHQGNFFNNGAGMFVNRGNGAFFGGVNMGNLYGQQYSPY